MAMVPCPCASRLLWICSPGTSVRNGQVCCLSLRSEALLLLGSASLALFLTPPCAGWSGSGRCLGSCFHLLSIRSHVGCHSRVGRAGCTCSCVRHGAQRALQERGAVWAARRGQRRVRRAAGPAAAASWLENNTSGFVTAADAVVLRRAGWRERGQRTPGTPQRGCQRRLQREKHKRLLYQGTTWVFLLFLSVSWAGLQQDVLKLALDCSAGVSSQH